VQLGEGEDLPPQIGIFEAARKQVEEIDVVLFDAPRRTNGIIVFFGGGLLCLTPSKLLSNPPLTARGGDFRRCNLSDHGSLHQYALELVEPLVGQSTPIILVFGGGVIAGIMLLASVKAC
jgi:hypothetical protein